MPAHDVRSGVPGMMRAGLLLGIALVTFATGGPSRAQPRPAATGVAITIADELVLPPNDPRRRRPQRDEAGNLITRPGDVIRYTLTATNNGAQPAHEVEMVDPIPRGTEYVLDSATGDAMTVTYSIDGGRYYQPPPLLYDFRKPDGTIEKRPVPAERYTHVKWLVTRPIPPRASVAATFRVRVSLPAAAKEAGQ